MSDLPPWLKVLADTGFTDPELLEIDKGEREAILLAEHFKADGILIDDLAGRKAAEKRGIFVIGTLGVLEAAARANYIDFRAEIENIKNAGFYVSDDLERFFFRKLGLK